MASQNILYGYTYMDAKHIPICSSDSSSHLRIVNLNHTRGFCKVEIGFIIPFLAPWMLRLLDGSASIPNTPPPKKPSQKGGKIWNRKVFYWLLICRMRNQLVIQLCHEWLWVQCEFRFSTESVLQQAGIQCCAERVSWGAAKQTALLIYFLWFSWILRSRDQKKSADKEL